MSKPGVFPRSCPGAAGWLMRQATTERGYEMKQHETHRGGRAQRAHRPPSARRRAVAHGIVGGTMFFGSVEAAMSGNTVGMFLWVLSLAVLYPAFVGGAR